MKINSNFRNIKNLYLMINLIQIPYFIWPCPIFTERGPKFEGARQRQNIPLKNYEVIRVCPEVMGGLTIPRSPSEKKGERVINSENIDVTKEFEIGASKTLEIALKNNVKIAILKKNSPSCGCGKIYNGTFTHTITNGDGITTTLLKKHGIITLNEDNYKDYNW